MQQENWYLLPDEDSIETPALIFYQARMLQNIRILKAMADDVDRLRPHVKTHKCLEVTSMLIAEGIQKFKCATIAEAEMLAMANAKDVLLAYQPVGENIIRFFSLKNKYQNTVFSCLVDNIEIAGKLAAQAALEQTTVNVYIDLNVGMNRTGILPELTVGLFETLITIPKLNVRGLHAYDGHIHDSSMEIRKLKSAPVIAILGNLKKELEKFSTNKLSVVAGGTPTFPIYIEQTDFECSPGTFILWDKGYQDAYPEQKFYTAALVASKIVSKPVKGLICSDLGHKAVAAEKPLNQRVFFINAPTLEVNSQSEEHLVLSTDEPETFNLGDMLYGLPYHICPTVALHQYALCLKADNAIEHWEIISRKRKIII